MVGVVGLVALLAAAVMAGWRLANASRRIDGIITSGLADIDAERDGEVPPL